MQIRLLAEGSTRWERFIKHWGISFLLDDDVLFDTFGDARVFSRNLRWMKIDTRRIRHIIISHDHWDHTGGLWPFLEKNRSVTVYICPGFGPETKARLASLGVRVVEAAGPREIKPGLYTTGQIKGVYAGKDIYEQAIVVKAATGLTVIAGCAHPGIVTMVAEVKKHFREPVFLAAGGFHLKDVPLKAVEEIIRDLRALGVQKVAPLHCTGPRVQSIFRRAFVWEYINLKVGRNLEISKQ